MNLASQDETAAHVPAGWESEDSEGGHVPVQGQPVLDPAAATAPSDDQGTDDGQRPGTHAGWESEDSDPPALGAGFLSTGGGGTDPAASAVPAGWESEDSGPDQPDPAPCLAASEKKEVENGQEGGPQHQELHAGWESEDSDGPIPEAPGPGGAAGNHKGEDGVEPKVPAGWESEQSDSGSEPRAPVQQQGASLSLSTLGLAEMAAQDSHHRSHSGSHDMQEFAGHDVPEQPAPKPQLHEASSAAAPAGLDAAAGADSREQAEEEQGSSAARIGSQGSSGGLGGPRPAPIDVPGQSESHPNKDSSPRHRGGYPKTPSGLSSVSLPESSVWEYETIDLGSGRVSPTTTAAALNALAQAAAMDTSGSEQESPHTRNNSQGGDDSPRVKSSAQARVAALSLGTPLAPGHAVEAVQQAHASTSGTVRAMSMSSRSSSRRSDPHQLGEVGEDGGGMGRPLRSSSLTSEDDMGMATLSAWGPSIRYAFVKCLASYCSSGSMVVVA